ncbi:sugar phosphate isomerase/epimerase and 4-hydroxyphenylpyruvate domain-containing protein [Mesorhizobium sp.]|uniref:bifunctional sugar phosphate isomerase/epimerase/4-hydroxyphenylpyruvate dioxygenase family protein n=1 Tax=Mesorhizobium sp. TaxID=1871066 RepID=UPI001213A6BC|nr:sugar phosphate isomerase/epimerase and 4-hydroxyphenylpyruvate domain-containing protein [Mesorhizobium sp.]TIO06807.1 MAG: sugar phosphate isomerase/epimerase and 4-hydroxyphenylpyruvate domain-containing protein [Mesorhizobium sp.]TIO34877.1 MAG: sugar phosphate isomerase/epimerase and 4-hydroxyphenylpyruvate domain-containing protein [Mesorhizobium sp.]TIP12090.1 MAG: sugar phosphate isomerase/epimerase and 4-hydroxyphenylpyruvate domain-containing protein [Mesorhizobium sp.]
MRTSIATVSIAGDLAEKLAAISAAGFDGVEIFENDFLAFDGSPRDVGQMARDAGLTITLFQPFRDFEGLPEPQRSRAFDRAERKFDVMQELGTDLMLVCSSVSPVSLGGIDRAAADFHELGERAAKQDLRVGYEALAWGRHVNDHRDAWEIVRRAAHPNIGLVLDSFHTLARKIDLSSIRSIPSDKIFIVQLADAPLIDMDLLYWSRHFRNMPGEGDLPVREFMQAVAATGYDDYISLEIFNDQFRGGSAKAISVDGKRSLVWLMDQVRREEPALDASVPSMPDRIGVEGIEFIEFAANPEGAKSLGTLLATLGFAEAGRHVSKDVTLYRQGEINIVVNTERQGFAHSSFVVHGTSAYAIGLKVEDAAATVVRAEALGAEIFHQRVGPDELSIPAIRGVGGGLVYFLDGKTDLAKVWDIEFKVIATTPDSGVGLTRIDHVGQTMFHEEMPSWLLFYVSLFRTTKTPMVDIVDPAGLVRSQVIEGLDKRLRLTLNGAESRRTLAGHFIAETFGSGVQHLAMATDDIFAVAKKLAANGFEPLQISMNYYDDVEARFGLDPDLADRLRVSNILYDRDDKGEFFQLYAPTFGEGFIFEIVERRGGYAGYGAPNAPFRIAAQKRMMRPKGMPRVGSA